MTIFVILREYSDAQGTYSDVECYATNKEEADLAIEFYTQRNNQRIKAYDDFMQITVPQWKNDHASTFNDKLTFYVELNKFIQQNIPSNNFDRDFFWTAEPTEQFNINNINDL